MRMWMLGFGVAWTFSCAQVLDVGDDERSEGEEGEGEEGEGEDSDVDLLADVLYALQDNPCTNPETNARNALEPAMATAPKSRADALHEAETLTAAGFAVDRSNAQACLAGLTAARGADDCEELLGFDLSEFSTSPCAHVVKGTRTVGQGCIVDDGGPNHCVDGARCIAPAFTDCGVCRTSLAAEGETCSGSDDCQFGLVCSSLDGQCTRIEVRKKFFEVGDACSTTCNQTGLLCLDGACVAAVPVGGGEACDTDYDLTFEDDVVGARYCINSEAGYTRCVDGECVRLPDPGEQCLRIEGRAACAGGAFCVDEVCVDNGVGAPCDFGCRSDLVCGTGDVCAALPEAGSPCVERADERCAENARCTDDGICLEPGAFPDCPA